MKICNLIASSFIVLILFFSCSDIVKNREPVVEDVLTDMGVVKDKKVKLDMSCVKTYDINGDNMSLVILPGSHYTVDGQYVVLEDDFVGDILVNVQVKDSEGNLSGVHIIILSVLPGKLEINPLHVDARWEYIDTIFVYDTNVSDIPILLSKDVRTSKLIVTKEYKDKVNSINEKMYVLEWTNLRPLKLEYIYTNTSDGYVKVGANGKIDPVLEIKYPVLKDDTWNYSPFRYDSVSTALYYYDASKTMECKNVLKWIKVPAGNFMCYEYKHSYSLAGEKIVVKLYFAVGVGMIKNITTSDGKKVFVKVLKKYKVEETE